MASSIFGNFNVFVAEQFVESVSELSSNSKVYITFGKTDAWANDASPATANSSTGSVYEVWSNMIGAKRVLGGDMQHVIPRNDWTANTIYYAYDHKTPNLFDANIRFHVVNSDYSVYKCISNNYGAVSTTEPTSLNPDITSITADGYVWKYMYTIPDSEILRFTTDNYIPVKTLMSDDGSLQWQVQDAAIDGSIERIVVTSGGSNYINVSTITVTIDGDGSAATAEASINSISNTISSITITESGMDYTYATITITDSSTGATSATAEAIISPPGGHGSNPLYELGGSAIIINPRLIYDEEGTLPVTNDYRQISIIKDPLDTTLNAISSLVFTQAYSITCDGSGDFIEDEIVYQGTSLATSSFSGRVVSWDPALSELLLINKRGTPISSQSINGDTSFTSRVITEITPGSAEPYSGKILFVDNITPITRADDQIENFQIYLKF